MGQPYKFIIGSSAPDPKNRSWGEYAFVREFASSIRRLGHEAEISGLDSPNLQNDDETIVVRIAGPHTTNPEAYGVNIVWQISHPEQLDPAIIDCFDGYFICSIPLAKSLKENSQTPVFFLPQATGMLRRSEQIKPGSMRKKKAFFCGNARGKRIRGIVALAQAANIPFDIIGAHWEGLVPSANILSEHVDYDQLHSLYSDYAVTLNDHWGSMKSAGMLNNRLFDTLAMGGYVICDTIEPMDTDLRKVVDCVSTPVELYKAFNQAISLNEVDFRKRQTKARKLVSKKYTFDRIAEMLTDALPEIIASKNERLKKFPFSKANKNLGQGRLKTLPRADLINESEVKLPGALVLAHRLQKLSTTFDKQPNMRVKWGPEHPKENFRARLPINEMTYDYQETCKLLINHFGDGEDRSPSTSEVVQIFNSVTRARLYLGRQAHQSESIRYCGSAPGFNLASRQHNHQYSYPGFHLKTMDRNIHKAFLTMPPLKTEGIRSTVIGVIVHVFFIDVLARLLTSIVNLKNAQLYISTDTKEKAAEVEDILISKGLTNFDIRIFQNRGRDVYSKFFGFRDIFGDHEIFLCLHTKRSEHMLSRGGDWLDNILLDIASDRGIIDRIASLFLELPQLGLLYPRPHVPLDSLRWGPNLEIARTLIKKLGIAKVPKDGDFKFPAGSMFWARNSVMKKIASLGLSQEDFPEECGQLDGTIAHAIERVVGIVPESLSLKAVCFSGTPGRKFRKFGTTVNKNSEFGKIIDANW